MDSRPNAQTELNGIKDLLRIWLALTASRWVYTTDGQQRQDPIEWILHCSETCVYKATARLRQNFGWVATFDVSVTGGAVSEWRLFLLVFKGTENETDMMANLGAEPCMETFAESAMQVHSGWRARLSDTELQGRLAEALQGMCTSDPPDILVAGHSLGGALAQVCMLWLWKKFVDVSTGEVGNYEAIKAARCFTFGSPAPFADLPLPTSQRDARRRQAAGQRAKTWMAMQCTNLAHIKDPVLRLPFQVESLTQLAPRRIALGSWALKFSGICPSLPSPPAVLKKYWPLCSMIMLGLDEPSSSLMGKTCSPTDDRCFDLLDRIPEGLNLQEHKVESYELHLLDTLRSELATQSEPLLQHYHISLAAGDAELDAALRRVAGTLQQLPQEMQDTIMAPYRLMMQLAVQVQARLTSISEAFQALTSAGQDWRDHQRELTLLMRRLDRLLRSGESYVMLMNQKKDQPQELLAASQQLKAAFQEAAEVAGQAMSAIEQCEQKVNTALQKTETISNHASCLQGLLSGLRAAASGTLKIVQHVADFFKIVLVDVVAEPVRLAVLLGWSASSTASAVAMGASSVAMGGGVIPAAWMASPVLVALVFARCCLDRQTFWTLMVDMFKTASEFSRYSERMTPNCQHLDDAVQAFRSKLEDAQRHQGDLRDVINELKKEIELVITDLTIMEQADPVLQEEVISKITRQVSNALRQNQEAQRLHEGAAPALCCQPQLMLLREVPEALQQLEDESVAS